MKDVRHDSTAQEQGERAEHPTEPSTSGRFLRGLTLGALVGAAIAGSAIWDRRRKHEGRAQGGSPDHEAGAD